MTPILKYPGAKWRMADWIVDKIPDHESYLEPFFGSGAVFFNKKPARIETINDIDGAVTRFFRVCRDRPDDLAYAVSMTPWSREEFDRAEIRDDLHDDIEFARQFMVRCWMSFGSRLYVKTGWRYSTGSKAKGGPDNPKLWARLPETIQQVADRLRMAQFESRPALDVIDAYDGPNVLIYADPPYILDTRTLTGKRQYRAEMDDADHVALLKRLQCFQGMVMLSGYESPIYTEILDGWTMYQTTVRCNGKGSKTECLWLNPEAERRRRK